MVFLSRIAFLGVLAAVGGCGTVSSDPHPSTPRPPPYGTNPREGEVIVMGSPQAQRPRDVEVFEAPRPVGSHVIFFSEPNFRGDSFVVETGADVENLARLPRQRGSWTNAISSFRIEGVARVLVYADANFQGPGLEFSSSVRDLVVERRNRAPDPGWDNAISSLRVLAPQARVFEREPAPRFDPRTADNIVLRAYRDILVRNPDADGLRFYREKLVEQNWSEEEVRNHLRRNNEFRANNPDEIIIRAYREVLRRDPDAEGLRHYRNLLVNQGWTSAQIRADLLRIDDRSDRRIREVITQAYRDILGRDPDPEGFATYQKAIREKGWGEREIRDSLARSDEARNRRPK